MGLGGIEKECDACGQIPRFFKKIHKVGRAVVINYFYNPLAAHCILITTSIFLVTACIAANNPTTANVGSAITLFGTIFVAMKFKLDQANYNKDLFDRRYALFLTIDGVLTQWMSEGKSTKELYTKISGDFMRRSYYLFEQETYQFIDEFRRSIIYTEHDVHETRDEKFKKEIMQAKNFLLAVTDGQKLAEKFPELKAKNY